MTMRNFDTELDRQGVSRMVKTVTSIEESVTVHHRPSEERSYLSRQEWGWSDLRDYVVYEIEKRYGTFPRDSRKEASIFKRFLSEWGDQAQDIARYAFDVADGRWGGAPISVNRFCQNSDPYFAQPIAERLSEVSHR